MGCILKENGYLERRNAWELGMGLCFLFVGLVIVFISSTPPRLLYFNNTIIGGNVFEIYITSISFVIGLMIVLKYLLKRGKFISWIGNNSIVLLVLHMLFTPFIYPIVGILFQGNSMYFCSFFIDIALCIVSIPIAVRFIPVFIGKKDLFKT